MKDKMREGEGVPSCLHLVGVWSYEYEGLGFIEEGRKAPDDADWVEMFKYCPLCGEKLEEEV